MPRNLRYYTSTFTPTATGWMFTGLTPPEGKCWKVIACGAARNAGDGTLDQVGYGDRSGVFHATMKNQTAATSIVYGGDYREFWMYHGQELKVSYAAWTNGTTTATVSVEEYDFEKQAVQIGQSSLN